MLRRRCLFVLLLAVASCTPPAQERIRDYNDDGVHLYRNGQYAAAGESFQAALALAPEDAGLLYNVGECADRLGHMDQAEQSYRQCLDRQPTHAAGRRALVVLLERQGRRDEAAALVQDWLAREPNSPAALATEGWLLHQRGDLPGAQARLQQALELDSQEPNALTELALVYEAMQRPDRAIVLYERALARDPNQPDIAHRLNRLRSEGVGPPRPD